MPAGRPYKLTGPLQAKMRMLYLKGFTDAQVADFLNISEVTITNWKKKFPELFTSLKDWKRQSNDIVELSLYEKAIGYTTRTTKYEYKINPETGEEEEIEIINETEIPPDTTACIYWTKNRDPKNWREKPEERDSSNPIQITYNIKK